MSIQLKIASPEMSKKLKEVGFDQRLTQLDILYSDGVVRGYWYNIEIKNRVCVIPTLALVQMWFRQANIHIEIYANASGWGWTLTKNNGTTIKDITNDIFFDTHDEALEAGISEAIKLMQK